MRTIVATMESGVSAMLIATLSDGSEVRITFQAIDAAGLDPDQAISNEDLARILARREASP